MLKLDHISNHEYTFEEIDKRNSYIPKLPEDQKGTAISVDFSDESGLFEISKLSHKFLPASIEYSLDKKEGFLGTGNKITRNIKKNFFEELEEEVAKDKVDITVKGGELGALTIGPDEDAEPTDIPLASEEKVKELTNLHLNLYSLLVKIQEANVASDFRVAYDIQDKISNIVDNRALQTEKLVDDLIIYMKSIIEKMSSYKDNIIAKQQRFTDYSFRISRLKEYKYKTDESLRILDEGNAIAMREVEKHSQLLGLGNKPK